MGISLSVEGVTNLETALNRLGDKIQEAQEKGLVEGAEEILVEVKSNLSNKLVHERTGTLKEAMELSSIQYSQKEGKHIFIGDIGKKTYKGKYRAKTRSGRSKNKRATANYAYFVEFGTDHSKAYPFMRSAYSTKKEAAVNKMVNAIKEALDAQ